MEKNTLAINMFLTLGSIGEFSSLDNMVKFHDRTVTIVLKLSLSHYFNIRETTISSSMNEDFHDTSRLT